MSRKGSASATLVSGRAGHGHGLRGSCPIVTLTAVPGATSVPALGTWDTTVPMWLQVLSVTSVSEPSLRPTAESAELAAPGRSPRTLGTATCVGGAGVGTGVGTGGGGGGGGGGAAGMHAGGALVQPGVDQERLAAASAATCGSFGLNRVASTTKALATSV